MYVVDKKIVPALLLSRSQTLLCEVNVAFDEELELAVKVSHLLLARGSRSRQNHKS